MPYSPPTKTVQDVVNIVTRQFGDESGTQVDNADIIRYINDAQEEIVKRNRVLKKKSTTSSVIDQGEYAFASLNILQVESLHYNGERLRNLSFLEAERYIISETANTIDGPPLLWYEWDGTFTLWPVPQAIESIDIYYTERPTPVTALADVLSVPDKYFQSVVQYTLQQAYEMGEDWEASSAKAQQFIDGLGLLGEEERTAVNMSYSSVQVVDF